MRAPLSYGNTPVPYTVLWSGEDASVLGPDPAVRGMVAVCNHVSPGIGRPIFGKPHMQRQREVVAEGRCDLCGRTLKGRTKVSLSHAQARVGADGLCVMQVEPLLHKACAALSLRHCPSLRRDLRNGTLQVRLVTRYRVQFAQLSAAATELVVIHDGRMTVGGRGLSDLECLDMALADGFPSGAAFFAFFARPDGAAFVGFLIKWGWP